jgi:hypothetical protein
MDVSPVPTHPLPIHPCSTTLRAIKPKSLKELPPNVVPPSNGCALLESQKESFGRNLSTVGFVRDMAKADPFDNDWNQISHTPEDRFRRVTFRDMMMRSSSWTLPSEWALVVRYENPETGQVMEKAYRNKKSALKAMDKMDADGWEHTYYDDGVMASSVAYCQEDDQDN